MPMKVSTLLTFWNIMRMQFDVTKRCNWSLIEQAAHDEVLLCNQLSRIEESSV